MEADAMRRQTATPHRITSDSLIDALDEDEQQPLNHSDHSDPTNDYHARHTDVQSFVRSRLSRLPLTVPVVTVLALVLVLVVAAVFYFHRSTPDEFATGPPHFPAVCLSSWEGQWGNLVYQLMFLLSYARRHNLTAYVRPAKPRGSNPLWHGYHITYADVLYGAQPCPWRQASAVVQMDFDEGEEWADSMSVPPLQQRAGNATLVVHDTAAHSTIDQGSSSDGSERLVVLHRGYYQFHTSGYRPYRDWLTRHMRPKADVEAVLLSLWYQLLLQLPTDMLLIAVHVRHGDYSDEPGSDFRRIPLHWYYPWIDAWLLNDERYLALTDTTPNDEMKRALTRQQVEQSRAREWLNFDETIHSLYSPSLRPFCHPANSSSSSSPLCVLVLSDDPHVVESFHQRGYPTVTPHQLLLLYQSHDNAQLSDELTGWYVDWWLLTRVGVVATSHSSFSHTATLYNVWGGEGSYWRPDATAMRLMRYEPWDSQYVHHVFKDVVFE